jgi:hypothetical protein
MAAGVSFPPRVRIRTHNEAGIRVTLPCILPNWHLSRVEGFF